MTYEDLRKILDKKNMNVMDFSKVTGISPQVICNAKKRGNHFSATTMQKMETFLSGDHIDSNELNDDETKLIAAWRDADESTRQMIIKLLVASKLDL